VDKESKVTPEIAIYLRVNDTIPGMKPRIVQGISEEPTKFSWWIDQSPFVKDIEFRYKLYPDDQEWSAWDSSKEAEYYFINAGQHEFRVQGKYKDENGIEEVTPEVSYSFTLNSTFLSRPVTKGEAHKVASKKSDLIPSRLYSGSRALLIGITNFNDSRFQQLPYVKNDLTILESVLKENGFEVKKLEGKITREQVLNAIEEIITSASENDRVIIYFSSHGFQDQFVSSQGYIACSDCIRDKPTANCISLSYLEAIVERGMAKPLKHILIIIDSCFSGLGVISKNTKYPDIARIATVKGAHMMTAGMSEQEAQMDNQLRMSVFTYFLTQGLSHAKNSTNADYTGDGIITLTELLLYVQYEVAKKTHGTQIPMLGRIEGQGEMIFDLR
jgi:hypothetical protein